MNYIGNNKWECYLEDGSMIVLSDADINNIKSTEMLEAENDFEYIDNENTKMINAIEEQCEYISRIEELIEEELEDTVHTINAKKNKTRYNNSLNELKGLLSELDSLRHFI